MEPEQIEIPETRADPTPARGVRATVGELLALLRTDRVTWFASVIAAFVLTASRYHASTSEYHRLTPRAVQQEGGLFALAVRTVLGDGAFAEQVAATTAPIAEFLYWFWAALLLFLLVPLGLARLLPGVRGTDFGTGLGDWRFGLKAAGLLYAVMLPFVVAVSGTPAFQGQYPMAAGAATSMSALVVFELSYAAYFIGWEFVNRGLLCVGLYPRLGAAAILLHTIPFAVMHAGKPEVEAYGSIVAGIALGALAVRARSFWYGALLHAAVAFTMDMLSLARSGRFPGLG